VHNKRLALVATVGITALCNTWNPSWVVSLYRTALDNLLTFVKLILC